MLALLVLVAVVRDNELADISTDLLVLVDGLPPALVDGLVSLVQRLAVLAPAITLMVLVRACEWVLMVPWSWLPHIAGVGHVLLSGVVEDSVPIAELGFEAVDSWFIGSQSPSTRTWAC